MKLSQKIGLSLFILGLLVFVFTLGSSKYELNIDVLKKNFENKYTGSGKSYYEHILPGTEHMLNKEYSSKFAFIDDFKTAYNRINDTYKSAGDWNNVMYDMRLFYVVKHSSYGMLNHYGLWLLFFIISFIVTCIGALMYIIPEYKGKTNGIKNNGIYHNPATSRGWLGITVGSLLIVFYIFLYWFPEYITNWAVLLDPLSKFMSGNEASEWFVYGFMYCLAMSVMGIRMMLKYKGNKYQQIRTASVIFFQLCFAFTLPEILARLNLPANDLKNMWPLDYKFFFDYNIEKHIQAGSAGIFLFGWGIALFLVGVPVFTYLYGKRWYCSWVCGCGGLAETLGDPYRQLSSKKLRAWKIERWLIHGVLLFAVVMTILVIVSYFTKQDNVMGISSGFIRQIYGFAIGAVFSGIVGTGFYPLMGNRVWCRFGCPLAAYIGIIQRFKSRFRITTNGGQCISCGNCSTYCEMGIDVRAYAQKGQNIVRASCVGCGICSAVCPRGVLKLENGPVKKRVDDNPILIGHDGIKLNL